MILHIDIETRSECDLGKQGAYKYSKDPTTEVLCVVVIDSDEETYIWEPDTGSAVTDKLGSIKNVIAQADYIIAHNFAFEYNILKHCLGIEIPLSKAVCTMAIAAYHNLPMGLGACAATLGLSKQKDDAGKKVMMKMCKPLPVKQRKNNGGDKWFYTYESMKTLVKYCIDDVDTEKGIYERLGRLPENEQKLWERDMHINYITGVGVDVDFCRSAIELANKTKEELKAYSKTKYGFSPTQVSEVANYCGLDDARSPTVRDALAGDKLTDDQREVLELRQIVGNTSVKKFDTALDMQVDGRIYGLLQYSGATQTHRWAGRGLQIQNFPRGSLDEYWVDEMMELFVRKVKDGTHGDLLYSGLSKDNIDTLKSCLRGMFCGNLSVCDYSQIEARVLPWLAGQDDILEQFRNNVDLYVYTASQIYRKPMAEVTKQERFIGKVATLALGFQGGASAFLSMAEIYGVKDMDRDFAEEIKVKWREANRKIKALWYAAENAAIKAVKFGDVAHCGKVNFTVENEFLKMNLPSGNSLFYYKPKIMTNPNFGNESVTFIKQLGPIDKPVGDVITAFGSKMGRMFTYGGKLVENMTQAVARDVMASAIMNLPQDKVIGSVHDEILCEDIELNDLMSAMLDTPSWCSGLPVGADGWSGGRYRK